MWAMVVCDPTTNTMSHENARTTIVRSAVARSESVFLIPHLARIEVSPAKTAEKNRGDDPCHNDKFLFDRIVGFLRIIISKNVEYFNTSDRLF